jgi:hypothetical protein
MLRLCTAQRAGDRRRGRAADGPHRRRPLSPRATPSTTSPAGFDPETHEETVETVVPKVIAWLASRTPLRTPTPRAVLAQLPAFRAAKQKLTQDWQGAAPWRALVVTAEEVAKEV